MVWVLSVIAFLLLGGYLLIMALRHGIPTMISDTFYQLGKRGWLFSTIILAVAFMMVICLLDSGKGIQCLAFLGCGGLAFVGAAPNYCDSNEYKVHKTGAIIAAIGCIGWCLSVCWWVTAFTLLAYAVYLGTMNLLKTLNGIWYISSNVKFHPWYWAEVAAFADVFATVWTMGI